MNTLDTPLVIIACPINEVKKDVIYDWLEYTGKYITYPNYEIYLVDNSKNKKWHKQLYKEVKHLYPNLTIDYYRPAANNHLTIAEIIAECQNKIVTHCKRRKAHSWFSLEMDNFTEQDAIERLMAHEQLVVGTYYHTYTGYERTPLVQMVENMDMADVMQLKPRLITYKEAIAMIKPELQQVHNLGLGTLLINMEVFDIPHPVTGRPIRFRSNEIGKGLSDSYFAEDLMNMEIPVYLDPTLRNEHRNISWTSLNIGQDLSN